MSHTDLFSEYIPGHVGCPRAGCEIKLVDVPEMNYLVTDKPYPRGEIHIRGATVFKGYFKDEKNTRDTVDSEGWLASGDIGFVDHRGCFTIIDRKKNIFKVNRHSYVEWRVLIEHNKNRLIQCSIDLQSYSWLKESTLRQKRSRIS